MPLNKYSRNPDGTYGPTSTGDFYISKGDHRRTAKWKKDKTRWVIQEGEEFSVFKFANEDLDHWYCDENNCIFSIIDGGSVILGRDDEIIAKFPNDRTEDEPWHGYPVTSEEKWNRPSTKVLDKLSSKKLISLPLRLRIEKGFI
ncbi:MAG: hypothetical protein ACO1N9_01755 [Flavobacterium sp.]